MNWMPIRNISTINRKYFLALREVFIRSWKLWNRCSAALTLRPIQPYPCGLVAMKVMMVTARKNNSLIDTKNFSIG